MNRPSRLLPRVSAGRRGPLGPVVLTLMLVAGLASPPVATAAPAGAAPTRNYIVQLTAPPLAGYSGGIRGFAATRPSAPGQKLDLTSAAAKTYRGFLDQQEQRVLAQTNTDPGSVVERYRVAFPGFAARLTPQQATDLSRTAGVLRVWPDRMGRVQQAEVGTEAADPLPIAGETADFLGLPGGLWKKLGGVDAAGAGVIVGVIDTGIYPEHPSFADQPETDGRTNYIGEPYNPPKLWLGACEGGEGFPTSSCNNKVIGARFFVNGFGAERVHPGEFLSPRDSNGHGSHTASTAAGNYGVRPVVAGSDLGVNRISGIAPRAYVAAYKVCWSGRRDPAKPDQETDGCPTSDSIAAVDAAVGDGVDVINFSVGSPSPAAVDPLALAFLYASNAGIFVSTAAGNHGPAPRTIGSPAGAPWVTSVAASSLGRRFLGTATLTDLGGVAAQVVLAELPATGTLPATGLVDAAAAPASGKETKESELCLPGSLDVASVQGKVVLCRRGENPLIQKGVTVKDAGGEGMIIYNNPEKDDVVPIRHWIPTVHVRAADGAQIKAFLAEAPQPAVAIDEGKTPTVPDVLAKFSSRGPQPGIPDIPKPDVTAPGLDILAADSPTPAEPLLRPGETFQVISGTSMASPHVAGAAALLTQLRPTLSPAAIKSSLMTTATTAVLDHEAKTPAMPFDAGSGRIVPTPAADPGLVLDAGSPDYLGFLESLDPSIVPEDLKPIPPSDLNLPAVSFSGLLGTATTTRTFTSIDSGPAIWRVSVEGLPGIKAEVSPNTFAITPGQSQPVTLRLTRTEAAFQNYVTGQLVLNDRLGGRSLHLPLTVEPVRMDVPPVIGVAAQAADGTETVPFTAGFGGDVTVQAFGLAGPVVTPSEVGSGQTKATPKPGPGVNVHDVTVEAGTQVIGGATLNATPPGLTDLDLYVYYDADGNGFDDTELIGQSAGPLPIESFAVNMPKPGPYRFSVVGYATQAPASKYDFGLWVVKDPTPDDASNAPGLVATDDPVSVTPGGPGKFTLGWSALPGDGVFLGLLTYHEGPDGKAEPFGTSLVVVTRVPGPAPAPAWQPGPGEQAASPPPRPSEHV